MKDSHLTFSPDYFKRETLLKNLRKYYCVPHKFMGDTIEGCDCYGLIIMVYRELFGLEVEAPQLYGVVNVKGKEKRQQRLNKFFSYFREVDKPAIMDVILYNTKFNLPLHVGIYIGKNLVMNMNKSEGVHVVKLYDNNSSVRDNQILAGFYRHEFFDINPISE